jgi:NADH-quinone oxidoreductase subunit C
MLNLDDILTRIRAAVPGAQLEQVPNGSLSGQVSVLVDNAHAYAVAFYLRDEPTLKFDYASNVTGIDCWIP